MRACTIIAKNYLAHARVLAGSFREHHPDGEFSVLVIDDFTGAFDPADEPFETLTPRDIGVEHFDRLAGMYSVLELSTAVKPWLLAHLVARPGRDHVVYLDPDIEVLGRMSELEDLLEREDLVLIPHVTEPMPRDGKKPSESDILIAGTYNLGFVGLRAGAQTEYLLAWWQERLATDCVVAPERGYFVDQRWMDFAPGLVERFALLRHPGYDVAYWNLPSRPVARGPEGWTAGGAPLRFFHYSGYDPDRPGDLSKHQNRVELRHEPALAELCDGYARQLRAQGYDEARHWSYSLGRLPGGMVVDGTMRRLYRTGLEEGALSEPLFTAAGEREFLGWLRSPAPLGGRRGINRYLADLWDSRPDLQRAFPSLEGEDGVRFLAWADAFGRTEVPLPDSLLPARAGGKAPPRPLVAGANVVGYLGTAAGTGEAARQLAGALEANRVATAEVTLENKWSPRLDDAPNPSRTDAPYPVNVLCVNADMVPAAVDELGESFFADRYTVGMWWWEVSLFPEDRWRDSFAPLDELWAGSRHIADALAAVSPVPVVRMPLPVSVPAPSPRTRTDLGLPEDRFLFLFNFDYHSVLERKNPIGLIEAFCSAFAPDEGPVLVLKSINGEQYPDEVARVRAAAADRPDVLFLDRFLPARDKDALVGLCDCYASLHRSEGFGITLAEAMALGKPVVATGYSGNLDFMTAANSFLVDHRLVPIGPGHGPYPAEGEWADPDPEHAARLLRQVYDDPAAARERAARGQADVRAAHSPQVAGRAMKERLNRIHARLAEAPAGRAGAAPTSAEAVERRLRRGPDPAPPGPGRAARTALRNAVFRVLKPYTVHQQAVNEDLARTLRAVEAEIRSLARAQERVENATERSAKDEARRLDDLVRRLDALDARGTGDSARTDELTERIDALDAAVQRQEAERRALPYMDGSAGFQTFAQPGAGRVFGYRSSEDSNPEGTYRSFEDVFRGDEDFIRNRQQRYVDLLAAHAPVLDAGCGRGEMLDLLAARGVEALGVDLDPGMVARCHEKGHAQVVEGDVVEFLAAREPESLGAIFCAQVIEHLPSEGLVGLLGAARRALRADGVLVLETVNPHSPPALKAFWVDPTHHHPLFPEAVLALCRASGFGAAYMFHPNGTGDVDEDRFVQGEYAVVATPALQGIREQARPAKLRAAS